MTAFATSRSSILALACTIALVGCANTPPSIRTNERPSILDHPSVLGVSDHDPDSTDALFLEAVESRETFGYCLPIGSPRNCDRAVLCLITELGDVYAIVDHSHEDGSIPKYEIGPAVRKDNGRYFLPIVDAELTLDERD